MQDRATSRLRRLAIAAAGSRPFGAAVALADRVPGPPTLTVLTYHTVEAGPEAATVSPGTLSATPPEFARQMEFVAERRRPVSLADVLAARDGAPLPHDAVLVTFDDAYDGFARHAWPVMRRLGVPGTLFVATGFADRREPFWWDRLWRAVAGTPLTALPDGAAGAGLPLADGDDRAAAYRHLRTAVKALPHDDAMRLVDDTVGRLGHEDRDGEVTALDWDALRRLRAEGVTLAAHSVEHPLLTAVAPERAVHEIRASLEALGRQLDEEPVPAFAYPGGAYDAGVVAAAEAAGCRVAFTTERGTNRLDRCRWLALRRVNVGRRTPLPLVQAQTLAAAATLGRWSGPAPDHPA